jgi:dipeptidyl aminopeptidase/acylaminoacyl peptidase
MATRAGIFAAATSVVVSLTASAAIADPVAYVTAVCHPGDTAKVPVGAPPGSQPQCDSEIYWSATGTDEHRVSSNEVSDQDPAFSPLGTAVAYVSWDSEDPRYPGAPTIWVGSADGSTNRRLTSVDDVGFVRHPTWSPDGRAIYFSATNPVSPGDPARGTDLFRIGDDGTGLIHMTTTTNDDDMPVASPDGRSLYFVRYDGGPRGPGRPATTSNLWMMNTDGGGERPLSIGNLFNDIESPAISPDGTWLAFRAEQRIWVARTDGSGLHALTPTPPPNPIQGPGLGADFPFWNGPGSAVGFYDGGAAANGPGYPEQVDITTGQRARFGVPDQAGQPSVLHPPLPPAPIPEAPPSVELAGPSLAQTITGIPDTPKTTARAARAVPAITVATGAQLRVAALDRNGVRSLRVAITRKRHSGCAVLTSAGWQRYRCAAAPRTTRIRDAQGWKQLVTPLATGRFDAAFTTRDYAGNSSRRPQKFVLRITGTPSAGSSR